MLRNQLLYRAACNYFVNIILQFFFSKLFSLIYKNMINRTIKIVHIFLTIFCLVYLNLAILITEKSNTIIDSPSTDFLSYAICVYKTSTPDSNQGKLFYISKDIYTYSKLMWSQNTSIWIFQSSSPYYDYVVFQNTSKVTIYQIYTNKRQIIFNLSLSKGQIYIGFVTKYVFTRINQMIFKYQLNSKISVKKLSVPYLIAHDVKNQLAFISFNGSVCQISVYSDNFTLNKQVSYNCSNENIKTLKYNYTSQYMTVAYSDLVDVWDMKKQKRLCRINANNNSQIQAAITCNDVLFVVETYYYIFYSIDTCQKLMENQTNGDQNIQNLKCFSNYNRIAYKLQNSFKNIIRNINFRYVPDTQTKTKPQPSFDNSSTDNSSTDNSSIDNSSTDNSSTDNSSIDNYDKKSKSNQSKQLSPLVGLVGSMADLAGLLSEKIISSQTSQKMAAASSVAGVVSSSTATQSIMRPFILLIQQFWFYGFHQQPYTSFVQSFSSKINIFNQLRIKPDFLDYEVEIQYFSTINEKINMEQVLQPRAPTKKFMLYSTKDIYTTNIAMVLASFLIVKILTILFKVIRKQSTFFMKMYHFFMNSSRWWTILIGFLESNIVSLVFYACIQFKVFFCYDPLSKLNLLFTIFVFFQIFCYVFLFYPFLFLYGRRKSRNKVTQIALPNENSFWLQMTVKCLRGFLQSTIHGILINYQILQLIGLITLDITLFILLIRMRKLFAYKVTYILLTLYFFFFWLFDMVLLAYQINWTYWGSLTEQMQVIYNFMTIVITLILIVITALRLISNLIIIVYEVIVKLKRKNKIQEELPLDKKQKCSKFSRRVIFTKKVSKKSIVQDKVQNPDQFAGSVCSIMMKNQQKQATTKARPRKALMQDPKYMKDCDNLENSVDLITQQNKIVKARNGVYLTLNTQKLCLAGQQKKKNKTLGLNKEKMQTNKKFNLQNKVSIKNLVE